MSAPAKTSSTKAHPTKAPTQSEKVSTAVPAPPTTSTQTVRDALEHLSAEVEGKTDAHESPSINLSVWDEGGQVWRVTAPPALNMRMPMAVPRSALTSSLMTELATWLNGGVGPSLGRLRDVQPSQGGEYTANFVTIMDCIESLGYAENALHFAQLWMLLYIILVATPGHRAYSAACVQRLNQHIAKREFFIRYTSSSLRLAAAFLHWPHVVIKYLARPQPHFGAFAQCHSVNWLMGGDTVGENLAAAVKYAMALEEAGCLVTKGVVDKDIVPWLKGRRTEAQEKREDEEERLAFQAARRYADDDPTLVDEQAADRMREFIREREEDRAIARKKAAERAKLARQQAAHEKAVIAGHRQVVVTAEHAAAEALAAVREQMQLLPRLSLPPAPDTSFSPIPQAGDSAQALTSSESVPFSPAQSPATDPQYSRASP